MAGAELGERVTEGMAGVALGVVVTSPPGRARSPARASTRRRAQRDRDRRGVLGRVQLAVDQAAVVVDDADHDRLAGVARLVRAQRARRFARWPGRSNFGTLKASMCNSAPASAPLIAPGRLALRGAPPPRDAVAPAGHAQIVERCRPTRACSRIGPQFVRSRASRIRCSSTALSAHGQDRGHRPARRTPHARCPLALRCAQPTIPRRRHRRRRTPHRTSDRPRLLAGEKARDHLPLGTRSEPASTVHPSGLLSELESWQTRTLRRRPHVSLSRPLSPQADQLGRGFRVQPPRS